MEMDTHEEVINADSNAAPRNPLSDFEHAAGTNISMGINSMTANNTQNELEEVTLGNHITEDNGRNHGESSSNASCHVATKNANTCADGDPFLAKLQEIDFEIREFDRGTEQPIQIPTGVEEFKENSLRSLEQADANDGSRPGVILRGD